MKYYKHDGVIDIRFTMVEATGLRAWLSHFKPDPTGTVAGGLLHILNQFIESPAKHNVSSERRVTGPNNYCSMCGIGNGGIHRPGCTEE